MLMARRVGFSPRSVEAVSTYGVKIHVIVALCLKIEKGVLYLIN